VGKYLKEGHREFGVPGNVFYKKALCACVITGVDLCIILGGHEVRTIGDN